MSDYAELGAFEAQCEELTRLLGELDPTEWERQTRCPPLSVRELVVHVAGVLPVWASFFDGEAPAEATSDRLQWWRYDPAQQGPRIVERAQRMAGELEREALPEWWRDNVRKSLEAFGSRPPEALVARSSVALPAADLVSVGVVEVGVHTMDIGHATLKGERLHKLARPVIVEVLQGLLGDKLPPGIGWDSRTFILTATGRRPLSANERLTLGPLAERFPVLA